jgi:uncharacterized protein (DUF2461 family)
MGEAPDFPGFPRRGLRFLSELQANNNREWFEAHKDVCRNMAPLHRWLVEVGRLGQ